LPGSQGLQLPIRSATHQHRLCLGGKLPYQDVLHPPTDVLGVIRDNIGIIIDVPGSIVDNSGILLDDPSITMNVFGVIVDFPCPLIHPLLY